MASNSVWNVPIVVYQSLSEIQENRPVAVITEKERWAQVSNTLKLPVVVQAEPERFDYEFLKFLADNVPSSVEAVYVVGGANQVMAGKVVAYENSLPLIIVPTELDTDQIFEPHVETMREGILNNVVTGPADQIIVDLDVIRATPQNRRAGMVADMLAIVTGLLDWRYAVKLNKNKTEHPFLPWAAGVAAGIASQTIKIAPGIGAGEPEALRNLMDLTAISVQLANQLGHSRHQEGTEHYLAFALEKQGVITVTHAEALGPGILLTSSLHGQDPSALRDALQAAGIRLNALRPADVQLAMQDLPNFVMTNDLPHGISHDLDPLSDQAARAMEMAGIGGDTGGWKMEGEVIDAEFVDAGIGGNTQMSGSGAAS